MVFANTTVAMFNRCAEQGPSGVQQIVCSQPRRLRMSISVHSFSPTCIRTNSLPPSPRIRLSPQAADAYAAAAAVRRTGSGSRRATVGVARPGAVGLSLGGAVNLSGGAATEPTTTKTNTTSTSTHYSKNKGRRDVPWIRAATTTTRASVKNVMRAIAIIVSEIEFF